MEKEKEKKVNPLSGFKVIKRNTKDGILNEIWQEDPKSEELKREWKCIKSWKEKKDFNPPSDHQSTGF
jgi:hypothetical protein